MIAEIKNDAQKNFFATMVGKGKQNMYREIKDSKFPPIGSRVRRGPDWKWNMQDSNGPGTVTGHDNGEILVFHLLNAISFVRTKYFAFNFQ
jgi:hypothetical protein